LKIAGKRKKGSKGKDRDSPPIKKTDFGTGIMEMKISEN